MNAAIKITIIFCLISLVANANPGADTITFIPTVTELTFGLETGDEASDSDVDPATGRTAAITLHSGLVKQTRDAGTGGTPGSIGDRVWHDININGTYQSWEPGVNLVTVNLLDDSGTTLASTQTNPSGLYQFDNLAPGSYIVEFVPPPQSFFTPRDQGGDDTVDSDADLATGRTAVINLASGETDLTWDAGLQTFVQVGDRVWYDTDIDGIQDAGELGVPGVTVKLLDAGLIELDTTVTDGNGNFVFAQLIPGIYYLEFVLPAGHRFSPMDQGSDEELDSDADPATGRTARINLASGKIDYRWDAGISASDLGDAPDPTYPTLLASNGAIHTIDGVTFLGATVDSESDGQPAAGATGDDTSGIDDEDGVTFTSPALVPGKEGYLEVTASVTAYLNIWIDFNLDGDWTDSGEWVVTDLSLTAGTHPLVINVPADAVVGQTYLRFRFSTISSSTGGYTHVGPAPDGEVEDHVWQIYPTLALLSSFEACDLDGQTVVQWVTDAEFGSAGFRLERLGDDGTRRLLNQRPVTGLLHSPRGGTYRVVDTGAGVGDTCTYLLHEVEVNGMERTYGPFTVTVTGAGDRHSSVEGPHRGQRSAHRRNSTGDPLPQSQTDGPAAGNGTGRVHLNAAPGQIRPDL